MKKIIVLILIANFCNAQQPKYWALNTSKINATNTNTIAYSMAASWTTAASACSETGEFATVVSHYSGSFANSTYLYPTRTGGNIMPFYYSSSYYYYDIAGNNSFQLVYGTSGRGYYITNLATCGLPLTYDYYTATIYSCSSCTAGSSTTVRVAHGSTITVGKYYAASTPDGNSYKITGTTTIAISVTISSTPYSTCTLACPI